MFDVLVFIDWYLPGYKAGGPVTSVTNMIEALRQKLRFGVVTSNTDYCAEAPYPNLAFNQWVKRKPNEYVIYLPKAHQTFFALRKLIATSEAKTIYINGIYSLRFSIFPLLANHTLGRNKKKKVVIASRGMLSQSAIGVKQLRKKLFLKSMRFMGGYRNVTFHATNQKEKKDVLREIGPRAKVQVASNIAKAGAEELPAPEKKMGSVKLVSIARVAPEKNLLFLIEALKQVRHTVELSIYGAVYNEAYWQQCHAAIQELPQNISVRYLGLLAPNEVSAAIQRHHFLVLPSLGENYGHVVAESLLAGRPVLISDQTPWKNLRQNNAGFDLELNPAVFGAAISEAAEMDLAAFDELLRGAKQMGQSIETDQQPINDHLKLFQSPV